MTAAPRRRVGAGSARPSPPVRLAGPADCEWMAHLSRDLIETGLGWRYRPPRLARLLARAEVCAVVALDADQPAGFAVMEFLDEHAHLVLLAVEPHAQRRGIARSGAATGLIAASSLAPFAADEQPPPARPAGADTHQIAWRAPALVRGCLRC